MTIPLAHVRGLGIRAGRRRLLADVSLGIEPGQVWAVLGANGSGKTLFLETLAGLRSPAGGSVHLAGRPAGSWSALEAARRRAFLPQSTHDAFGARALDVVLLGRHPHLSRWGWEGEAERRIALEALDAVQARDLGARDVVTLSGGERQRVAIAAVLAQQAPLLLLDEPVAHLDLHHQVAVLARLARLAGSGAAGVALSIHDLNLAARFATHAVLLRGDGGATVGAIGDVMGVEALSSAFRHPVARADVEGRAVFVLA